MFVLPARARLCQLLPYWSRRKGSNPSLSSRASGARKVTWTTPGWRPISIAPVIVARFLTSGTRHVQQLGGALRGRCRWPRSGRARCRPPRSAPTPRARRRPTPGPPRLRALRSAGSAAWPGRAGPPRPATGSGRRCVRPLITCTCSVTVPETSQVWPAISPSPWSACMSPR